MAWDEEFKMTICNRCKTQPKLIWRRVHPGAEKPRLMARCRCEGDERWDPELVQAAQSTVAIGGDHGD